MIELSAPHLRAIRTLGALALTTVLGATTGAGAAECARKLTLLGPNASDTRKLEALLTCAEEAETALGDQARALSALERQVNTLDTRLTAGLAAQEAAVDRKLTALEGKVARDIAASAGEASRALAAEARTLRNEIRMAGSADTGELRALKTQVTALDAKLGRLTAQTWTDFGVAQRGIGRSYSNSTAQPIVVSVTLRTGGSGNQRNPCHGRIKVEGMTVAESRNNNNSYSKQCFVTTTVPPGANYIVESAPSGGGAGRVAMWTELR